MNSDGKKISFGFTKLSKKPNILHPPKKENDKVELIDCLEGTEIKVKTLTEEIENSTGKEDAYDFVKKIERESSKKSTTEKNDEDLRPDSELTIEELAARQLLREARNKLAQGKDTTKINSLLHIQSSTVQDGIEPSVSDYENIPVEDFGLALLQGMVRKEGTSSSQPKFVQAVRPTGLGLGAQRILDVKTEDVFDKNGKQLVLMKGAFAKIVAGPHKGKFCEIQFCDQSGRISVKTSKTNEILILNELFVVPITKDAYITGSKVINNVKYEQYKQMEENEGHSNKNIFTGEIKNNMAPLEESCSRSDDSQYKKEENISGPKKSQKDRTKIKLEYDSYDEKISSNDKYGKERNKVESSLRYNEKIDKDHVNSRSRDAFDKSCKKISDRNERDSSIENTKEKTETKYNSGSRDYSEEYERKRPKMKHRHRHNSRDSSEEYSRRKQEEKDLHSRSKNKRNVCEKTEFRRSRSRESLDNSNRKNLHFRGRSTSSEDYGRNKLKSRNRSRSSSSSTQYKKKSTDKNRKHSEEIRRSKKKSSKYSDSEYERSRSRESFAEYDKKNSRSTSSEDYERNKSKSRNRRRYSRSSSPELKKKSKNDKKYLKEKKGNEKSSRYSDDDYKRKDSKNHRQKNDTDEESSYETKHKSKSKKNKKSKRKCRISSESD